jgi:hypothetical protein
MHAMMAIVTMPPTEPFVTNNIMNAMHTMKIAQNTIAPKYFIIEICIE